MTVEKVSSQPAHQSNDIKKTTRSDEGILKSQEPGHIKQSQNQPSKKS